MDKGRAGRGGTERDGTNAGGDRNAGRYGGAGATDGCVLCHFLILSALLLILLLSDCLFFLQSTPACEAGWGVRNAVRTMYCSHPPREVEGATGVYSVIFVCYSPLLFFSLFLFFVVSFFCGDINRRAGAGTDRTDAGGDRNVGRDKEVNR